VIGRLRNDEVIEPEHVERNRNTKRSYRRQRSPQRGHPPLALRAIVWKINEKKEEKEKRGKEENMKRKRRKEEKRKHSEVPSRLQVEILLHNFLLT